MEDIEHTRLLMEVMRDCTHSLDEECEHVAHYNK
jgi:hypothetical protein